MAASAPASDLEGAVTDLVRWLVNGRAPLALAAMGKLKKFLLRYYPPGIILEYEESGAVRARPIRHRPRVRSLRLLAVRRC